jgi:hypothetical protein
MKKESIKPSDERLAGDSVKGWAERLGVSERLIWKEIGADRLEAKHFGRRTIITNHAMNAYLERDSSKRFDARAFTKGFLG